MNHIGGYYDSALHAAIMLNSSEIFDVLLRNGASPRIGEERHVSAIKSAISEDRETFLLKLIKRGRLSEEEVIRSLAHYRANFQGSTILALIDAGVDFKLEALRHYLSHALTSAIRKGDASMARLLLEKGANLKSTYSELYDSLDAAVAIGDLNMVCLLLDHGALIQEGALNQAVSDESIKIVEAFLEILPHKAVANAPKANGRRFNAPLHKAAATGNIEIARMLIQHGLDVKQITSVRAPFGH